VVEHLFFYLKTALLTYKIDHSHTNCPKYSEHELTHVRYHQRELTYAHTGYQHELTHAEPQRELTHVGLHVSQKTKCKAV